MDRGDLRGCPRQHDAQRRVVVPGPVVAIREQVDVGCQKIRRADNPGQFLGQLRA